MNRTTRARALDFLLRNATLIIFGETSMAVTVPPGATAAAAASAG